MLHDQPYLSFCQTLRNALLADDTATVESYLRCGLNPNLMLPEVEGERLRLSGWFDTPLGIAFTGLSPATCKLLVRYGAVPTYPPGHDGFWENVSNNLLGADSIESLLALGGKLTDIERKGLGAVHACIRADRPGLLAQAIASGVPLEHVTDDGYNFYHYAIWSESLECLDWLLRQGLHPDTGCRPHGVWQSPLAAASLQGESCVAALLEAGADPCIAIPGLTDTSIDSLLHYNGPLTLNANAEPILLALLKKTPPQALLPACRTVAAVRRAMTAHGLTPAELLSRISQDPGTNTGLIMDAIVDC